MREIGGLSGKGADNPFVDQCVVTGAVQIFLGEIADPAFVMQKRHGAAGGVDGGDIVQNQPVDGGPSPT